MLDEMALTAMTCHSNLLLLWLRQKLEVPNQLQVHFLLICFPTTLTTQLSHRIVSGKRLYFGKFYFATPWQLWPRQKLEAPVCAIT